MTTDRWKQTDVIKVTANDQYDQALDRRNLPRASRHQ